MADNWLDNEGMQDLPFVTHSNDNDRGVQAMLPNKVKELSTSGNFLVTTNPTQLDQQRPLKVRPNIITICIIPTLPFPHQTRERYEFNF